MTPALLFCALAALAQGEIPANDGWITDRAGLLAPGEERALEALCESYRAGSGQEIAVLIVPDLGGRPLEELSLAVARAWKIGDRETSSGALLLVARDEHALRIEVGRGHEGALPDAVCGRIIRDVIVPEFRAQRFAAGLSHGLEAIHRALGGDYGALPRDGGGDPRSAAPALVLVVLLLVFLARRRRAAGVRGGRGSSVLPWLVASQLGRGGGSWGGRGGGFSGGGFSGFGGGGGFSGGGASGRW